MDYNKFLKKLRELYIDYLLKVIPEEAYKNSPMISKEVYADTIYTDIMALGYNFGDIDKAADDKMEMTATLPGVEPKTMGKIRIEIQETANLYPTSIKIFSNSHLKMQAEENPYEVLEFVKTELNSALIEST